MDNIPRKNRDELLAERDTVTKNALASLQDVREKLYLLAWLRDELKRYGVSSPDEFGSALPEAIELYFENRDTLQRRATHEHIFP